MLCLQGTKKLGSGFSKNEENSFTVSPMIVSDRSKKSIANKKTRMASGKYVQGQPVQGQPVGSGGLPANWEQATDNQGRPYCKTIEATSAPPAAR